MLAVKTWKPKILILFNDSHVVIFFEGTHQFRIDLITN
jgi:hypothetical protein